MTVSIGMSGDCPTGVDCSPPTPQPAVQVRPAHVTAQVGAAVSFETVLSNVDVVPAYRWSRSSDGGVTFADIAGATGPVYTLASATRADDGTIFLVEVNSQNWQSFATAQLAVSAVPPVVFQDGEFALNEWDVVDDGSTLANEQVASGGHPGAFRRMSVQLVQPAGPSHVFHFARAALYDPATQGAIYVIDFAEDGVLLEGTDSAEVSSYPALEQSGRRYEGINRIPDPFRLARQWGHEGAYASLTARDFFQYDGPPCGTGEACPDFSAGAAPLRFGFLRIANAWVEGPVVHGIDNWRVAVWPR